jgi:hypothetical protein
MANSANIIKIKRSSTANKPSTLYSGELAYSYGTTPGNNPERLFFGSGDDGNGNATRIDNIGGLYYTRLIDASAAGTLTTNASSIPILSSTGTIDDWKVGNLELTGNTLSSTNTNGNILLAPNGSGVVSITTSGQPGSLTVTDTGINGANIKLAGNGSTTPSKSIRSFNGNLEVVNDAYSATILSLSDAGYLTVNKLTIGTGATSFSLPTARTSGDGYYLKASTDGSTSWAAISATTLTNGSYTAELNNDGTFQANSFLAAEGAPNEYGNAGYSFQNDGGFDTGMFSSGDGNVTFYANNTVIASFNNNLSGLNWTFDTPVTFTNGSNSGYTLPTADGTTGYVLTTNGMGTVTWQASASSLSLKAGTGTGDTGTDATVNLLTDSFQIEGDSAAITTALTVTGTTNKAYTLEVAARLASTSQTGVAKFDNSTFGVDVYGNVTVSAGGISNTQLANSTITVNGTILTLGDTSDTITAATPNALTNGTNIQTFSFDGSASGVQVSLTTDLIDVNTISSSAGSGPVTLNASGDHSYIFNTDGTVTFNSAYTFPSTVAGGAGYVLTDAAGNGTLSWAQPASSLSIPASGITGDTQSAVTLNLLTDQLSFAGDGTININETSSATVSGNIYTYTATIADGAIGNGKLAYSSITVGGTSISLGGTATTITGLTEVDVGNLKIATNDISAITGSGDQDVVIKSTASDGSTTHSWTFGSTGDLEVAGKITNVTDPTNPQDAATKAYVDATAS